MSWCENNSVDYVFGLAKNERLERLIKGRLKLARRRFAKTAKAARVFGDFRYRTRKSWRHSSTRRSTAPGERRRTASRSSRWGCSPTAHRRPNSGRIRLYFSSIGYCVLETPRRLGLAGTKMARAQCTTIRLRLLKIGARIRITARKVWISLATGYAWAGVFAQVYENLERGEPQRS